jgi:hypothetical protein
MKARHVKAELRNELRPLGAVKELDCVHSKPKVQVADPRTIMCETCHGDVAEGIASNAKMLSEGTGDFAELCNLETIALTDCAATNDAAARSALQPKNSMSGVPVIAGKQTTAPVLEKNSFGKGAQVSGRALKRGADDALTTIKKAVSFVLPLPNDDGSPHDSENSVDDIDTKALDFSTSRLHALFAQRQKCN